MSMEIVKIFIGLDLSMSTFLLNIYCFVSLGTSSIYQ